MRPLLAPSHVGGCMRIDRRPQAPAPRLAGGRIRRRCAIVGIGTSAVASIGIGGPSLWTDEVATRNAVSRGLLQLGELVRHVDATHSAYYALMWAWARAVGTSPVALRSLSALFAGISAAEMVILAGLLWPERPQLEWWVGIVFGLAPTTTSMALEARSYALTCCLAAYSAIALVLALRREDRRGWARYAVATLAVGIVFAPAFSLVLAHGTALAWSGWERGRRAELSPRTASGRAMRAWAPWAVGILAVGAPWMWWVQRVGRLAGQLDWLETPDLGDLLRQVALRQWFRGSTLLGLGCWALLAWAWLRGRRSARGRGGQPLRRRPLHFRLVPARLALAWMGVPTLLMIAVTYAITPMYTPRYLIFATPGLSLLLAPVLERQRPRPVRTMAVLAALALLVPGFRAERGPYAKDGADWKTAATVLRTHARSGEPIVFLPDSGAQRDPRRALEAYPASFAGLRDVGLVATATARRGLWGVGASGSVAARRTEGSARTWVLVRRDRIGAAHVRGLFAGRSVRLVWQGPSSTLYEVEASRGAAG